MKQAEVTELAAWLERIGVQASACAAHWRGCAEDEPYAGDAEGLRGIAGMWDLLAEQAGEWARRVGESK